MAQSATVQTEKVDQAAQLLVDARRSGKPLSSLPESCRPNDVDSALAIQDRVVQLFGQQVGGYKCGVPSAKWAVMMAPVFAPSIYRSSPVAVRGEKGRIEPEIAFVLNRDLPSRAEPYTDAEIKAAIGQAMFVLELIGCRYVDVAGVSYFEMLADSFNNFGMFVGIPVANVFDLPLESMHVTVTTPTETLIDRVGSHPSGHPFNALSWFVKYLNGRGKGLTAGQVITTGSYAGIVEVPLNTPVKITLGNLGTLALELIPAN